VLAGEHEHQQVVHLVDGRDLSDPGVVHVAYT
jgi:hypothetical protein